MSAKKKHGKRRPRRYMTQARQFVRDYTAGLNVKDVKKLLETEAPRAYAVLARDQDTDFRSKNEVIRIINPAKVLFLGISSRLSPVRRILFAAAIVSFLVGSLGAFGVEFAFFSPVSAIINASSLWFTVSVLALLFLLMMELVDRVRVRDELEVAQELQRDLLPQEAPNIEGYSFAHGYRTANEVGGDYYDFSPLPDGRLAITVGDASGHGIAAGLLMAIANATLTTAIEIDPAPKQVTALLNTTLCRTGDRRAFMTLFYGVLTPETGELDYVGAGHPFPLLRRANGEILELGRGSLPLGMREDTEVPGGGARLDPGDMLVLFTDGLPEAVSPSAADAFGFDKLRTLLEVPGSPQGVYDRILTALELHLGDGALTDDFTLVVMARDGGNRASTGSPPHTS